MWPPRPPPAWLLLTWTLIATATCCHTWRPCTDLQPLDLLSRALPPPGQAPPPPGQAPPPQGQAPPPQVQVVQSRGSRGLRLGAPPLSFPSSQIFTECHLFPAEFSLVATLRMPRPGPQVGEFLFSVVADGSGSLVLGLRVFPDRVQLLLGAPGGRGLIEGRGLQGGRGLVEGRGLSGGRGLMEGRGLSGGRGLLTFGGLDLRDGGWHTLVLAVSGKHATLTTDCGPARELLLVRPFPSSLSTQQTRFFIGSRGRGRGRFSGLLRQLVLLPGADARPRLCYHGYQPGLEELAVPQVLKSAPLQPDQPGPLYPYEAEARVTAGNRPRCSGPELGQLWLDARNRGLFICDGRSWRPLLHRPERLDYLEDYQDLYTHSETFDMEVFSIPSEGLFLAAANRDPRLGSGIYRWRNGSFQLFQNISTQGARAWKSFSIQHQVFLVVAEVGGAEPERSAIFRWHRRRRRFARFQTLQTHTAQDWEFFRIHNNSFLVVANHRQGSRHNIDSVIYRWNPHSQLFELNQTLPTLGAYDWEFFEVGPFHFLAVANTFDGRSTVLSSTVYVWQDGRFRTFQNITTVGATDWEFFQIGGRFFLAVANSQQVSVGRSLYSLNSTVYELHAGAQAFLRFQDIPTHSALDWEFFTVGEQNFLVVANSHDGSSYSLNSVVYRWQGYEGFVPVHVLPTFGCRDWEHFRTPQGSFLLYSSATSRLSKVFRLRTY